jgi:AcrR family transcriptional regulator
MTRSARGGRYHHGDLRAALIDTAVELIGERGVRDFSVAEASRRLGVSAAAPYRHFADREELLAAVAARALGVFAQLVTTEAGDADAPEQRLAAMGRAYVQFAAGQRPLFDTLFSTEIDKTRYPELQRAWEPVDAVTSVVREICEGDGVAAKTLAEALEAAMHGHAALLLNGDYGQGQESVEIASDKAAHTVLAVIAGRSALNLP